jgi:hypothetical protein
MRPRWVALGQRARFCGTKTLDSKIERAHLFRRTSRPRVQTNTRVLRFVLTAPRRGTWERTRGSVDRDYSRCRLEYDVGRHQWGE